MYQTVIANLYLQHRIGRFDYEEFECCILNILFDFCNFLFQNWESKSFFQRCISNSKKFVLISWKNMKKSKQTFNTYSNCFTTKSTDEIPKRTLVPKTKLNQAYYLRILWLFKSTFRHESKGNLRKDLFPIF